MKTKSITKSDHWCIYWIMPLLLFLCLAGCKDENENRNSAPPFDPSQPVKVTDFLPKEGGIGQRLVIYGDYFSRFDGWASSRLSSLR